MQKQVASQVGNEAASRVGRQGSRRMATTFFILGTLAVLLGAAVGYRSYSVSRRQILEHTARSYLSLARNIGASQDSEDQLHAPDGLLHWHQVLLKNGTFLPGSYLCFVNSQGTVTLNTGNPAMVDKSVGDLELTSLDGRSESTIEALLRARRDWTGFLHPYWGSTQIGALAYIPRLNGLIAVHVPFAPIEQSIQRSFYPWLLGLTVILGGLIPLSGVVVFRAYRGALGRVEAMSEALQLSEKHNRDSFHQSRSPICLLGEDGRIIELNQAASKLFDYTPEEAWRLKLADLYQDSREVDEHLSTLREQGWLTDLEVSLKRKDGEPLQCLMNGTVRRGPDRGVSAYQVILQDITLKRKSEAARLASERRWQYVVGNAPDVIMTLDSSGVVQTSNRALAGFRPEEIIATRITDYLEPAHRPRLAGALRRALETGRTQTFEMAGVGIDGAVTHYSSRLGPIGRNGERNEFVLISTDVTRSKLAEDLLERHSGRQRALIELGLRALGGVHFPDLLEDVVRVARQELPADYCWVVRRAPDERLDVMASSGWEEDPRGNISRFDEPSSGAIAEVVEIPLERLAREPILARHDVKQGVRIPMPDRYTRGAVMELFFVEPRELDPNDESFLRMTATLLAQAAKNRRAQEALEISNARYRELADALPQTVFETDLDGHMTFLNADAYRRFGFSRDGLDQGLRFLDLLADQERGAAGHLLEEIKETRKAGSRECLAKRGNADEFPALVHVTPILRGFECTGFRGILIDLTEVKGLEEQLLQSQRMEAFGRLAGGIAHDFNNILTGIAGYVTLSAQLIEKESTARGNLEVIEDLCERGASLIRQLLAFSRRQPCHRLEVDLNQVIENVLVLLRRVIGEDVELRFEPDDRLGDVRADPGQIEQLLMNLAVNARDAMPTGGELTISTVAVRLEDNQPLRRLGANPGWHAQLIVADTGTGMDDTTRRQIFEPFFTTKEEGKGTGLGLSTVYGIVRQHNGYISVDSELGAGTTFRIYLPLLVAQLEETGKSQSPLPQGRERILLVEDEEQVRTLLEKLLAQLGYQVVSAGSPREAEELAGSASRRLDLLVSDVVMPGCSGPELYRRLTRAKPDLRVLYLSGYADEHVLKVHRVSDAPFLQKPFAASLLARKVREALDGHALTD